MLYLPTRVRLGTVRASAPGAYGPGSRLPAVCREAAAVLLGAGAGAFDPRTSPPAGGGGRLPCRPVPVRSLSSRCQHRGWLSPRASAYAATFRPSVDRITCLALLVPALTLWGPGRRLTAPPPRARRSATTAIGCPPLRPTHQRQTFSAVPQPQLGSTHVAAGELLRFR